MRYKKHVLVILSMMLIIALTQCTKLNNETVRSEDEVAKSKNEISQTKPSLIAEGKNIFRYDSFGDEDFWSGLLHIDKAILGANNGGFGPGVSPATALAVGLKVDAEALPPDVVAAISSGAVDLNDPATTIALLKLLSVNSGAE